MQYGEVILSVVRQIVYRKVWTIPNIEDYLQVAYLATLENIEAYKRRNGGQEPGSDWVAVVVRRKVGEAIGADSSPVNVPTTSRFKHKIQLDAFMRTDTAFLEERVCPLERPDRALERKRWEQRVRRRLRQLLPDNRITEVGLESLIGDKSAEEIARERGIGVNRVKYCRQTTRLLLLEDDVLLTLWGQR